MVAPPISVSYHLCVFCFVLFSPVFSRNHSGGGVLTLTWYTYMCLPFGALFREIWYSDRVFFYQRRRSPNYINWVYFGQIIVKSTHFDQNWVPFFRKWYTDGWEIWQKIGIEIVRFSRSGRHMIISTYDFGKRTPPPGKSLVHRGFLLGYSFS